MSSNHFHQTHLKFIHSIKMAESVATVFLLTELVDSDDENPHRGKTRNWIRRRRDRGYFNNIIKELRLEDRFGFRDMFRMDIVDFEYILGQISDLISPKEIIGGTDPILADERLALTLRFLATGESFQSLSYQFRISLNAVSYIVKGCCKAIVDRMTQEFLKTPSSNTEWLEISKKFEEKWNYPHALGAIDGKHVRIQKPKNAGSFYYNYKHTHSIILMAIAGPNYECIYADVGSNGRVNDSGIWNKTSLLQGIQDGSIKLPSDEDLPNGESIPYVFLGDDAFALKTFMMKPFPQQGLSGEKRVYNYRHSRARRISENLFGILSSRWRIFFTIINLEPKYVEDIIFSTLILHNFLLKSTISSNLYRPPLFSDTVLDGGEVSEGEWRRDDTSNSFYPLQIPRFGHNSSQSAKLVREKFMHYFVTDGAVDWQWQYC